MAIAPRRSEPLDARSVCVRRGDEATVDLPRELDEDLRFRRVEVRGELVAEPQFLLDNMLHDGVAGYHVLTALRVAGRSEHVLVNRGWVADGRRSARVARRRHRAATCGPSQAGSSDCLGPGMRLGADDASDAAAVPVAVLQYPTAAELARRLGQPVYDFELLLDAAEPDGFVREWQPPGVPPERNVAYAGQWFALCLGAFAAAVVMAFRTARRKT